MLLIRMCIASTPQLISGWGQENSAQSIESRKPGLGEQGWGTLTNGRVAEGRCRRWRVTNRFSECAQEGTTNRQNPRQHRIGGRPNSLATRRQNLSRLSCTHKFLLGQIIVGRGYRKQKGQNAHQG